MPIGCGGRAQRICAGYIGSRCRGGKTTTAPTPAPRANDGFEPVADAALDDKVASGAQRQYAWLGSRPVGGIKIPVAIDSQAAGRLDFRSGPKVEGVVTCLAM